MALVFEKIMIIFLGAFPILWYISNYVWNYRSGFGGKILKTTLSLISQKRCEQIIFCFQQTVLSGIMNNSFFHFFHIHTGFCVIICFMKCFFPKSKTILLINYKSHQHSKKTFSSKYSYDLNAENGIFILYSVVEL